jgi:hypothetical protein
MNNKRKIKKRKRDREMTSRKGQGPQSSTLALCAEVSIRKKAAPPTTCMSCGSVMHLLWSCPHCLMLLHCWDTVDTPATQVNLGRPLSGTDVCQRPIHNVPGTSSAVPEWTEDKWYHGGH